MFVVIGLMGPGLFQLKPPNWLGGDEEARVEVLEPLAEGESVAVAIPQSPFDQSPIGRDGPVEQVVPATVAADAAQNATAGKSGEVVPKPPEGVVLGGPNAGLSDSRLAALQSGTIPEAPAVRARVTVPKPEQAPEMAPRTARLPAVPKLSPVPVVVGRDFTRHIPDSHVGLPVAEQKESFVAMVLPLILAANEEIAQRRKAVRRAAEINDRPGLERWAKLYRLNGEGRSLAELEAAILMRADYIPVSLALAQAAIESGWGTSRFARQGNALFGQWAWQASAGIKPAEASNSRAVVRSFPNLFGSVRAYMHNLNTHPTYANFRERRHMLRGHKRADTGLQLANYMDSYAEIGSAYVDKLQALIRSNDFGRFETARLR